jgi:hypothetical protein
MKKIFFLIISSFIVKHRERERERERERVKKRE